MEESLTSGYSRNKVFLNTVAGDRHLKRCLALLRFIVIAKDNTAL